MQIQLFLNPWYIYNSSKQEALEDIKREIRIPNSKKTSQHNCQKKKDNRTNNDPQNYRSSYTNPTKTGGELGSSAE
jgi:hypothetical protein